MARPKSKAPVAMVEDPPDLDDPGPEPAPEPDETQPPDLAWRDLERRLQIAEAELAALKSGEAVEPDVTDPTPPELDGPAPDIESVPTAPEAAEPAPIDEEKPSLWQILTSAPE